MAAALLLLLLGSCSQGYPLDVVARDGRVLIWTKRQMRWFIIPHRRALPAYAIEVWSGKTWMWRVESKPGTDIMLPVTYGIVPPGAKELVPARPLRPGIRYVAAIGHGVGLPFQVSADGREVMVGQDADLDNPEEAAASEARGRRLAELLGRGLTMQQAAMVLIREEEVRARGRAPASSAVSSAAYAIEGNEPASEK